MLCFIFSLRQTYGTIEKAHTDTVRGIQGIKITPVSKPLQQCKNPMSLKINGDAQDPYNFPRKSISRSQTTT